MTGATAEASGASGFVPAPVAGDEGKYLKGDGTWAEVSTGLTNLVDGSAEGSVRGTGTLEENQEDYEYTIGEYAFVEGYLTRATGDFSHAEGFGTKALGQDSHAEGNNTEASNYSSHAEGYYSKATGHTNHVEGYHTIASGKAGTHVQGMLNVEDTDKTYLHIVGNGTEDFYMNQVRSNAHTIDWDGNAWFAGDVYVGSTSGTNKDEGSKKLATEEWVSENAGGGATGITATLSASGWTEQSDGSYAQTVSVAGVTEDNQVVVDVALSGSDMDADIEVLKAWGYVNRASQAVDSLTFYCYGDVPTVSIPLNVVVM